MVTTIREAYRALCTRLTQGGIEDAAFTARQLLEAVTGLPLPQLLANGQQTLTERQLTRLQALAGKRLTGYPLQYLLQSWDFYGLTLQVGEGVLIPRQDTETLVDFALACCTGRSKIRMLDLCSGTGCIALAVASQAKAVTAFALESQAQAMTYLSKNIEHYPQLAVTPIQADALRPETAKAYGRWDLITCNPPYLTARDLKELQREVSFEPASALYGGEDGLSYYQTLTPIWSRQLLPGGWLIYEIGIGQEQAVSQLLRQSGLCAITQKRDSCGVIRVVAGQMPKENKKGQELWQKN